MICRHHLSACTLAALAFACASPDGVPSQAAQRAPVSFTTTLDATSPLVGRVLDVRGRRDIGWGGLLDALGRARFVLLGERHDQPDHHVLQARIVSDLTARGARPAVALEMVHMGQAAALVRAQATAMGDAEALAQALAWDRSGWPAFALYRPIFDAALAAGLPLVAANAPPERVRAVARGAADAEARALLERTAPLPEAGRAELATQIQRGHCGHAPEAMITAMVEAQRVRDAAMAEALVAAAGRGDRAGRGPAAVLIAGNGHVSRITGAPLQLAALAPGANVASVALLEVQPHAVDPFAPGADPERDLSGFDYVVFTPRLDDGDPCETFREQLERMNEGPRREKPGASLGSQRSDGSATKGP